MGVYLVQNCNIYLVMKGDLQFDSVTGVIDIHLMLDMDMTTRNILVSSLSQNVTAQSWLFFHKYCLYEL